MALFQATARGTLPGGEVWANVFHFTDDDLPAVASAQIAAMLDDFYIGIASRLSAGWTLTEFQIKDMATQEVRVFPRVLAGLQVTDNLPNEVALVISWTTAVRSRRTRGRTYLAGFTETSNTGNTGNAGRPNSDMLDVVVPAASALISVSKPARLVIYSRVGLSSAEVSGGYINNEWDSQRRRSSDLAVVKFALAP